MDPETSSVRELTETSSQKSIFWTVERLMKLAVAILLGAVIMLGLDLISRENQIEAIDRMTSDLDRNRAEVCRLQISLEIPLSDSCRENGVTRYFDTEEVGDDFRTRISYVLCFIATQTGAKLESACG